MRCVIKGLHCLFFIILQVGAVGAFAQTLRRYTSLNHLAQAARAVLQNTSQINQMLTDLNRVDFANVQVSLLNIKILKFLPFVRIGKFYLFDCFVEF